MIVEPGLFFQTKTNNLLFAERTKHVPRGCFNVHPIFAEKARGAIITDVEGKEYIDFAGGIGTANIGHCNKEVLKAIQDQIQKYMHTCFHVVMYEPYVELAKRLNQITPGNFPKKTMLPTAAQRPWRTQSKLPGMPLGDQPPLLLSMPFMVEPFWP